MSTTRGEGQSRAGAARRQRTVDGPGHRRPDLDLKLAVGRGFDCLAEGRAGAKERGISGCELGFAGAPGGLEPATCCLEGTPESRTQQHRNAKDRIRRHKRFQPVSWRSLLFQAVMAGKWHGWLASLVRPAPLDDRTRPPVMGSPVPAGGPST